MATGRLMALAVDTEVALLAKETPAVAAMAEILLLVDLLAEAQVELVETV